MQIPKGNTSGGEPSLPTISRGGNTAVGADVVGAGVGLGMVGPGVGCCVGACVGPVGAGVHTGESVKRSCPLNKLEPNFCLFGRIQSRSSSESIPNHWAIPFHTEDWTYRHEWQVEVSYSDFLFDHF